MLGIVCASVPQWVPQFWLLQWQQRYGWLLFASAPVVRAHWRFTAVPIIPIAAGGGGGLVVVVAAVCCYRRRKAKQQQATTRSVHQPSSPRLTPRVFVVAHQQQQQHCSVTRVTPRYPHTLRGGVLI